MDHSCLRKEHQCFKASKGTRPPRRGTCMCPFIDLIKNNSNWRMAFQNSSPTSVQWLKSLWLDSLKVRRWGQQGCQVEWRQPLQLFYLTAPGSSYGWKSTAKRKHGASWNFWSRTGAKLSDEHPSLSKLPVLMDLFMAEEVVGVRSPIICH